MISAGWTLSWMVWQGLLLYENHAYRMIHTPGERFEHAALLTPHTIFAVIAFVIAFAGLHIVFAWANWSAFHNLLAPRIRTTRTQIVAFTAQLIVVTLTFCLLNAWYYTQSLPGNFFSLALLQPAGPFLFVALAVACALYFMAWIALRMTRSRRWRGAAVCAGALTIAGWGPGYASSEARITTPHARPNVVLIGIDSLRPDYLRSNGAPFSVTPNLDQVLAQSTIFSDTLSTQPHTFPATVSILTGQWPTRNGARGNLFPPNLINSRASMAHAFRKAGYQTIFAMDETRFANIDERYGFDRLVGPPMGILDFMMSITADNVLVNLTTNSTIGRWLFPAIYGNRAIDYVYDPRSFTHLVDGALDQSDTRPLFLYVHLCAGHWPYRSMSLYQDDNYGQLLKGTYVDGSQNYLRALGDVDAQLGHVLGKLTDKGLLNNTILVTFSDHGEDFSMAKDVLNNQDGQPATNLVNGHGGSAFRAPQTQVLLAMRRYGSNAFDKAKITAPASLVDIAPTLFDLVGLPKAANDFDGVSLARFATGHGNQDLENRIRYIESSFFPGALNTKHIDAVNVLDEVAKMYEFTPAGRVQVRDNYIDLQISRRQRAAQRGEWIVATREDDLASAIVINRKKNAWWPIDKAPKEAPSADLMESLCQHWLDDHVLDTTCQRQSGTGITSGQAPTEQSE